MPTQRQRDFLTMMAGLNQLGDVMEKKRKEKLIESLLGQYDPGYKGGGIEGYKIQTDVEDRALKRQLAEAQLAKALRVPQGRGGGSGEMTDLQRLNFELKQRAADRQDRNTESLIQQRSLGGSRNSYGPDTPEKLDKDLRKEYGISSADIESVLRGQTEVDDSGNIQFETSAGVPMTVQKDALMPFVNRAMGLYSNKLGEHNARRAAEQTQPKVVDNLEPPLPLKDQTMVQTGPTVQTTPAVADPEAREIRRLYKAGQMTKEEALRRLEALGIR